MINRNAQTGKGGDKGNGRRRGISKDGELMEMEARRKKGARMEKKKKKELIEKTRLRDKWSHTKGRQRDCGGRRGGKEVEGNKAKSRLWEGF